MAATYQNVKMFKGCDYIYNTVCQPFEYIFLKASKINTLIIETKALHQVNYGPNSKKCVELFICYESCVGMYNLAFVPPTNQSDIVSD